MKINEAKTKDRLKGVAMENRVWIYDATLMIKFLNETFMPTKMFLVGDGIGIQPGQSIRVTSLKDRSILDDYQMSFEEIYQFYLMYRDQHSYTNPIETRYKFKMLLNKMKLYKNNWEFIRMRRGREQKVFFAPVMLRSKASLELRTTYPVPKINLSEAQIPVEMQDLQSEEEPEKIMPGEVGEMHGIIVDGEGPAPIPSTDDEW
jgi:hypothetical protein